MFRKAFTLIELLVVIAIIAILAAILFPVFTQAKAAAKKTQDISNFKQQGLGVAMYIGDSDGGYPLSNSGGPGLPGWGFGPPDTVPAQALQPYMKNFQITVCPNDPASLDARLRDQLQYMTAPNNSMNTVTPTGKAYAYGVRSNMGYNYQFLSPWRLLRNPTTPTSATVTESQVGSSSSTLLFVNSIWDRSSSGAPIGGGNWVVETPCWEDSNNVMLPPMNQYATGTGDGTLWSYAGGWSNQNNWLVYGGAWPFHNQVQVAGFNGLKDGHCIVLMADTSAKSRTLNQLTRGCTAFGTGQLKGNVTDKEAFIWDLE